MAVSEPDPGHIPCGDLQVPPVDTESINQRVDEISHMVISLEQKLKEVEEFYSRNNVNQVGGSNSCSVSKDTEKGRHVVGIRKVQQEAARREAAAAKRMHDLMRQFGTIVRQISQHRFAWPFNNPVNVESLGLHDYYTIIDKPMDFSTIKNQMEAKDGTGYKHVMQIHDDMRLVFANAMKYNEEKSNVYSMAKTLLEKFEEKWAQFLPKVQEEEKRREEDGKQAALEALLAKEASHTKTTRELSNEICSFDDELEKLRQEVLKRCRKISTEEKRNIGFSLQNLSSDELHKVLVIVAEADPSFQPSAEEVDITMDLLDESTLWKLKIFVKDALDKTKKKVEVKSEEIARETQNVKNRDDANKGNASKRRTERRIKRPRV